MHIQFIQADALISTCIFIQADAPMLTTQQFQALEKLRRGRRIFYIDS